MTRIVVSKLGEVSGNEVVQITNVMKECYERLEPHEVVIVDLQVFESASQTEAFLSAEYARVGVVSGRFDEKFFALHHAWRGTPVITLCIERMRELPPMIRIAGIRHEVGHSILHGELKALLPDYPLLIRQGRGALHPAERLRGEPHVLDIDSGKGL